MNAITFQVGDKVTARSISAKAILLGQPKILELAKYPSLIGCVAGHPPRVELTIDRFQDPWIICTRASGTYAPALMLEDLELWGAPND